MNFPKNLMYTKTHEWVLFAEDDRGKLLAARVAQDDRGLLLQFASLRHLAHLEVLELLEVGEDLRAVRRVVLHALDDPARVRRGDRDAARLHARHIGEREVGKDGLSG